MLTKFYSYIPRSGSRVIASNPTDEVAICAVRSGTIAVGDLGTVTLYAAKSGEWYRPDAARFAREVVDLVGGLAEDDGGYVSIVTPRRYTAGIWELAQRSLPITHEDYQSVPARLWREGCLTLTDVSEAGAAKYERRSIEPVTLECHPGWKRGVGEDSREAWPAIAFRIGPHDDLFVTDKGHPVTCQFGDREYTSPKYQTGFLAIGEPHVDEALRILGIDPSIRSQYQEFDQPPVPEGIEWVIGGDDSTEYIHVDTSAARLLAGHVQQLEVLAYAVNFHADLPEWAGWESWFEMQPAPQSS